jgi:hypothetical protein
MGSSFGCTSTFSKGITFRSHLFLQDKNVRPWEKSSRNRTSVITLLFVKSLQGNQVIGCMVYKMLGKMWPHPCVICDVMTCLLAQSFYSKIHNLL